MATGLLALLDDVAAIAKVAAASLDDVGVQAVKASKQAVGIVVDDAAVTPRYVQGFAASRELPMIAKIAWGSAKNKLLYLLPAALLLSYLAPWAITPLLMAGGLYLCFEGSEKVLHLMRAPVEGHGQAGHAATLAAGDVAKDAKQLEDEKVAGAIRTDFILSAEIMAISLASVTAPSLMTKAIVLAAVGLLITAVVYGAVAMIVKADDVGLFLAKKGRTGLVRAFGRGLVDGMPPLLKVLSFIGMLAMLWVGGGIFIHGLEELGVGGPAHFIHGVAAAAGNLAGPVAGFARWLVDATIAGVVGLGLGLVCVGGLGLVKGKH